MNFPLISIIVAIYNVEEYLPKCVESILNQTYSNIELILVVDGSPDNSLQICERYAAIDSRVKVLYKENGGQSTARNAGLFLIVKGSPSICKTKADKQFRFYCFSSMAF